MKNPSKGNNNKNEIELLLRKALRIKQKPSQELNDSIIRQYEKNIEQRKITRLLSEVASVPDTSICITIPMHSPTFCFTSQRIEIVWNPSIKVESVKTIIVGAIAAIHFRFNKNLQKQTISPICRINLGTPALLQYIIKNVSVSLNKTYGIIYFLSCIPVKLCIKLNSAV